MDSNKKKEAFIKNRQTIAIYRHCYDTGICCRHKSSDISINQAFLQVYTSKSSALKLKSPMMLFFFCLFTGFFSSRINSYFSPKYLLEERLAKNTTITNLPQKSWPGTSIVVRPGPASNTTNS